MHCNWSVITSITWCITCITCSITSSNIPLHVQLHAKYILDYMPLHPALFHYMLYYTLNYMLKYMLHYILNYMPLHALHGIKFPEPMITCFLRFLPQARSPHLLKRSWCSRSSLSAALIHRGLAREDPPQPP